MSQYQKMLESKVNNEIKLDGLEALVSEELEKHLSRNSSRLRTFEDARREIVTYVESKFGLRTRDSKPSGTGLREHSDPMDAGAVNSFSRQSKEKGSSVSRVGCFKCRGAHFQRDCYASKNAGKQASGKGNQGKSWSKSESSTTGSWIHEEWSPDGWNDDGSCVGWHEDSERMCCTTVRSFSLENSERVNVYLDTGAAVDLFPVKFDREGVGDGISHDRITSVEAWRFQGTDAHRVLGNTAPASAPASEAAEIAYKEQELYVGHNGGFYESDPQ